MPTRELHNFLNRLVLDESFDEVNEWIDEPYRVLGPGHRALRHDLRRTPRRVFLRTGKTGAAFASILHIELDRCKALEEAVSALYAVELSEKEAEGDRSLGPYHELLEKIRLLSEDPQRRPRRAKDLFLLVFQLKARRALMKVLFQSLRPR